MIVMLASVFVGVFGFCGLMLLACKITPLRCQSFLLGKTMQWSEFAERRREYKRRLDAENQESSEHRYTYRPRSFQSSVDVRILPKVRTSSTLTLEIPGISPISPTMCSMNHFQFPEQDTLALELLLAAKEDRKIEGLPSPPSTDTSLDSSSTLVILKTQNPIHYLDLEVPSSFHNDGVVAGRGDLSKRTGYQRLYRSCY